MKIIITENQQRKLSHIFTVSDLLEQKRAGTIRTKNKTDRIPREIEEISLKGIVQEISNDLNDLLPKIAGTEEAKWDMTLNGKNPENMSLVFNGKTYPFKEFDGRSSRIDVFNYRCGTKPKNYGGGAILCSSFKTELQIPDLFNKFITAYPEYAYLFKGKYENDEQTNFIKKQINNVVVNVGFEPGGDEGYTPAITLELVKNSRKFKKSVKENTHINLGQSFEFYKLVKSSPGGGEIIVNLGDDYAGKLTHSDTQTILSNVEINTPPPKTKEIIDIPPVTADTFAREIDFAFQVTDPFQFDKPDLTPNAEAAIKKEMAQVYALADRGFLKDYLKTKINGKDIIVQAYSSIDAKSEELGGGAVTDCKPGKVMRKEYNLCLSQKRAETIVNHLNVAFPEIFGEANLIAKGMGELESPNSVNEPYYIKATAEHIKKYPELKLRLGQRFRNPPQKKHSDANRVATAADRKFVINLPGYTGVITEGAIRDIILTESQIKRLTMFQPGNEMSLNEIIPTDGGVQLKKGSRGEDVKLMQQELVNRKYSLPRYGVDGRFGPETEGAVESFQQDHGLTVDGVVTTEVLTVMKDTKNTNPNPSSSSSSSGPSAKSNETASISDDLIVEIINGTISAGGSKEYTDLFPDSNRDTAVGILHFTKRGLKKLYEAMDTEKWFGKSEKEMEASIGTYDGGEIRDSSWKGCTNCKNPTGMLGFLHSSESESVQNKAASRKFKNGLTTPIQRGGWTTPREYAVGMFFLNSYPACLKPAGLKYGWDAEKMLKAYCTGECSNVSACRSRCNHINKSYPISASAEGYTYQGC